MPQFTVRGCDIIVTRGAVAVLVGVVVWFLMLVGCAGGGVYSIAYGQVDRSAP